MSSVKLYLCLIYSVDNIVKYDTSVHTFNSATHHIESISAGIWCEETSQEETNKHIPSTVVDYPNPNPKPYTVNITEFQVGFRQISMYIGAVVPLCAVACFIWTEKKVKISPLTQ